MNSIAVVRALSTSTSSSAFRRERAPREREAEGAEGADAGAFGGREDAAVDAAHDEDEERGDGPDVLDRVQPLAPAGALGARAGLRIAPA